MTKQYYCPDLLEVFQKGIHEIIPANQVQVLFGDTQPGSLEFAVDTAIKELGVQAASGLFFQTGSAVFKHLVRSQGSSIGIDSLEFRLQPQRKRLSDGLDKLIKLLESWQAAVFSTKRSGDSVEVMAKTPEGTFSATGKRIWLHFIAGLFQEYLYWAGGGKQYPFEIKSGESADSLIICFQLLAVD
jgi:hypothetical protein